MNARLVLASRTMSKRRSSAEIHQGSHGVRVARQTRPFFLAVLLMAVCGLISATAWADRLALVEVRAGEGLSPEIRKRFEAAAVKGLSSAGHSVISPDDVRSRLQGRGALAGCRGGDCVRPMTQALSVEGIVVGEVAAQEKNYVITLRLLRPTAAGASEVAKADERCDICTQAEADQAVEKAATNLGQQAAKLGPAAPPTPSSVVVTPPAPNGGPSAAPSAAPSSSLGAPPWSGWRSASRSSSSTASRLAARPTRNVTAPRSAIPPPPATSLPAWGPPAWWPPASSSISTFAVPATRPSGPVLSDSP